MLTHSLSYAQVSITYEEFSQTWFEKSQTRVEKSQHKLEHIIRQLQQSHPLKMGGMESPKLKRKIWVDQILAKNHLELMFSLKSSFDCKSRFP